MGDKLRKDHLEKAAEGGDETTVDRAGRDRRILRQSELVEWRKEKSRSKRENRDEGSGSSLRRPRVVTK